MDPTARIDCLPVEIVAECFEYLSCNALFHARATSRRWREIATHTRPFWQEIDLQSCSEGSIDLFKLRLAASRNRPVNFSVRNVQACAALLGVLEIIAEHLHHARTLELAVPQLEADLFFLCARCPAPILQSLHIAVVTQRPDQRYAVLPADFLAGHAPALRQIYLSNVAFPPQPPAALVPARELTLGWRTAAILHDIGVITQFPALQHLSLDHWRCQNHHAAAHAITFAVHRALQRLQSLSFSDTPDNTVLPVLLNHWNPALMRLRRIELEVPSQHAEALLLAHLAGPLWVTLIRAGCAGAYEYMNVAETTARPRVRGFAYVVGRAVESRLVGIDGTLPRQFEDREFLARVRVLTLPLSVLARGLLTMPALSVVRVHLDAGLPSEKAEMEEFPRLACPELRTVTLSAHTRLPARDVLGFCRWAFAKARWPFRSLYLEGIELHGEEGALRKAFGKVTCRPLA